MDLKVNQCGRGPFIALVVIDPFPSYTQERTAHGVDTVSHNIHVAKTRYRRMSGGGFKVHGTFSAEEANHDILMLFHKPKEEFLPKEPSSILGYMTEYLKTDLQDDFAMEQGKGEKIRMSPETFGMNGWSTCADLVDAVLTISTSVNVVTSTTTGKMHREDCKMWPKSLAFEVPTAHHWAIVATVGGTPEGADTDVDAAAEPSLFMVWIGGVKHIVKYKVVDG